MIITRVDPLTLALLLTAGLALVWLLLAALAQAAHGWYWRRRADWTAESGSRGLR